MNVEAGWLLRNHKYIVSRRRFLGTLLKDSEKMMSVDENDVIDARLRIYINERVQEENRCDAFKKKRNIIDIVFLGTSIFYAFICAVSCALKAPSNAVILRAALSACQVTILMLHIPEWMPISQPVFA